MDMKQYFENHKGLGVLATADAEGKVNAAIYARPHVQEDGSMAFIMTRRLTYHNLQSNPHALYLFKEEGSFQGKRLSLTKTKEEDDPKKIEELKRRIYPAEQQERQNPLSLVHFRVDQERDLVESG